MDAPARPVGVARVAWTPLFAAGVLLIFLGIVGLVTGYTFQGLQVPSGTPNGAVNLLQYVSGELSAYLVWVGFAVAFIAVFPFRAMEPWAWYLVLSFVLFHVPFTIRFGIGPVAAIAWILEVIALILGWHMIASRRESAAPNPAAAV
jgi:hypothetical protein